MDSPTLHVQSGPLRGQILTIVGNPSIGRADDCDLTIAGYQRVSRHHARLNWNGNALAINDSGSTNGVMVNGQKISGAVLHHDDSIELGDFSARVQIPPAVPAPAGSGANLKIAGAVRSGVARQMNGWRALGAPQRFGIAGAAAIVLLLGVIGLRGNGQQTGGQSAGEIPVAPAARMDNMPSVPAAPPASAAQTQLAPAIEPVGGKLAPTALDNVKAATVLIAHRDGRAWAMGSGFALADARRIVTNRHVVVNQDGRTADCQLVFEAGTPRERSVTVSAQNIRIAPQTGDEFADDLATITLDAGQTPALSAGASESLQETDEVYAVGFPLGVQTLTTGGDLPSVSVKPARVERLQTRKDGAVSVIQLGSSVTHGNSGGPVVNNRGEVVGVISSGVEGTGMSYAIPMVWVKALS